MLYSIKCNWTTPYTIPGVNISEYNVTVLRSDTKERLVSVKNASVETSRYIYDASEFGNYSINVVPIVGELAGDDSEDYLFIDQGEINSFI